MAMVNVSVSDFPSYDGSGPPEDFLRQCARLAALGCVPDDKLGAIIAARCHGRALTVVNSIEDGGGVLSVMTVTSQLQAHFGGASGSVERASQSLATLSKGHLSAQDYGMKVRQLVRQACPELFGEDGQVKKICVPSYNAALYRHFLVGLSPEERCLLSRQKASSFEQCLSELTREEGLEAAAVACAASARRVRWDGPGGADRELAPRQWSPAARGRSCDGGSYGSGSRGSPVRERHDWEESEEEDGGRRGRPSSGGRSRWSPPVARSSPPDNRYQSRSGDRTVGSSRRRRSVSPWGGPGWRPSDTGRRADAGYPAGGGSRNDTRGAPRRDGRRGRDEARQPRASGRGRAPPERATGGEEARDLSPARDDSVEGRRSGIVRCWACGGVGHFKRQCPNGLAGRRATY